MMEKKKRQPEIEAEREFTGWAVFNWGISLDRVFRTRKEAREWCCKGSDFVEWFHVSDHYKIVKVKCIVIG